jgi:50S ribosomal subunit-associated GTPase HflX
MRVELAQIAYQLPRLHGAGRTMSLLAGAATMAAFGDRLPSV